MGYSKGAYHFLLVSPLPDGCSNEMNLSGRSRITGLLLWKFPMYMFFWLKTSSSKVWKTSFLCGGPKSLIVNIQLSDRKSRIWLFLLSYKSPMGDALIKTQTTLLSSLFSSTAPRVSKQAAGDANPNPPPRCDRSHRRQVCSRRRYSLSKP